MSEIIDNTVVENSAQRRARIRRQKIMSDSDNRIKKILSINDKKNDINDKMEAINRLIEDKTDFSVTDKLLNCGQRVTQKDNQLVNDSSDTDLRHRFNGHSFESEEQTMETIDRTFPRKVSLISTPIDYKTLQQSHQNNTTSLTSHLVWMLCHNQSKLSIISVLLLAATVGSLLRLNFILPFIVTQLFRFVIIFRSHRSNGSNKSLNNISNVFSVLQHLVIFVFIYILIQIFI